MLSILCRKHCRMILLYEEVQMKVCFLTSISHYSQKNNERLNERFFLISIFDQYTVLNSAYVSTYSFLHIGYTLEAGLLTGSEIYLPFFAALFAPQEDIESKIKSVRKRKKETSRELRVEQSKADVTYSRKPWLKKRTQCQSRFFFPANCLLLNTL